MTVKGSRLNPETGKYEMPTDTVQPSTPEPVALGLTTDMPSEPRSGSPLAVDPATQRTVRTNEMSIPRSGEDRGSRAARIDMGSGRNLGVPADIMAHIESINCEAYWSIDDHKDTLGYMERADWVVYIHNGKDIRAPSGKSGDHVLMVRDKGICDEVRLNKRAIAAKKLNTEEGAGMDNLNYYPDGRKVAIT